MNKIRMAVLWAVLAIASPVFGNAIAFYDGSFNAGDWDVLELNTWGAGGSFVTSQEITGGNPSKFMKIGIRLDGAGQVSKFCRRIGAVYDPGSQGAIASIDYSEDDIMLPNKAATGPAIRQDGVIYRTNAVIPQENEWTTYAWVGLTEVDFREPADTASHPDFSPSGLPIELGFFHANSNPGGSSPWLYSGIDNWSFTVHPVPEPATMSLLSLGGLAMLRRRKSVRG